MAEFTVAVTCRCISLFFLLLLDDNRKIKKRNLLVSGLLCHLDDACTSNPCHEGAICDTSPVNGSFACSCATGYKGVDCSEDIDECEQGE